MNSTKVHADLRILATSDVHMHITGWDPLTTQTTARRGMDILAGTIAQARRAAPGACILVDNGDGLQGTPVGTLCARTSDDIAHPWPAILNQLEYDALGLGNHDFDFGLPFLEQFAAQADAPVLCASLRGGSVQGVMQTTVLPRQLHCSDGVVRPLRIGMASVLPPQTAQWCHRHLAGRLSFLSGVLAGRRAVAALRKAGADIVVMLCHSGLSALPDPEGENFATALAATTRGIDAMVLGHTHQTFPAPHHTDLSGVDPERATLHGIPAVMPGFAAQTLGVIDLGLRWSGEAWRVGGHVVSLHDPRANQLPDGQVQTLAAPAIAATRDLLDTPLGHTDTGFHSYFDMLRPGQASERTAATLTRVVRDHVNGTVLADLPLVTAIAPAALGGRGGPSNFVDVPVGTLRERHLAMLTPYANTVWAAVLSGADLYNWAERAATYFSARHGAHGPLVDAASPAFNFDALYGLEAIIDPFQPARFAPQGHMIAPEARRITKLTHKGRPIAPDAQFLVAMTSYRGAGGGLFPGLDHTSTIIRTDINLADALRTDLQHDTTDAHMPPPPWRLMRGSGTMVAIRTSPKAERHLNEIAEYAPAPMGYDDQGFLILNITL